MNSDRDTPCGVGCPIRRSRDHRSLASPPGFSQRATSFIASQCQGIHQMPFSSRLITGIPVAGNAAQPPRTGPNPRGPIPTGSTARPRCRFGASLAGAMPTGEAWLRRATTLHPERGATPVAPVAASHEDTSPDTPPPGQHPRAPAKTVVSASVTSQLSLHPSINNPAAVARDGRSASPNAARGAAFSATPGVVEVNGFEPMTSCLQSRRSPS